MGAPDNRIDNELVIHDQLLTPEDRMELTIELSRQALEADNAATRSWLADIDEARIRLLGDRLRRRS